MECVELTFQLHPLLRQKMPRANTPAGWLTFGLHEDLDEAALMALEGMVEFMEQHYRLERHQALGLTSVLVDMVAGPVCALLGGPSL